VRIGKGLSLRFIKCHINKIHYGDRISELEPKTEIRNVRPYHLVPDLLLQQPKPCESLRDIGLQ